MTPTYTNSYKGCKVYVYDLNSGKTVAETIIREWDKQNQMIIVDNTSSALAENTHVSILILHKDSLHEYKGTIRRTERSQNIGIALFQGREKEEFRSCVRYTVHLPAKIVTLMIGDKIVPLKNPLDTTVLNISKSGMLIRTVIHTLNVGTRFQIKIRIGQLDTILNLKTSRIHRILGNEIEFGCSLIN